MYLFLHLQLYFLFCFFFFFNDTATTEIYTLSLHDALPISAATQSQAWPDGPVARVLQGSFSQFLPSEKKTPEVLERSEEHTSELQSRSDLVCRLLLEKKKKKK